MGRAGLVARARLGVTARAAVGVLGGGDRGQVHAVHGGQRGQPGQHVRELLLEVLAIAPTQGAYNWAPADELVNWPEANGIALRGHALLWH